MSRKNKIILGVGFFCAVLFLMWLVFLKKQNYKKESIISNAVPEIIENKIDNKIDQKNIEETPVKSEESKMNNKEIVSKNQVTENISEENSKASKSNLKIIDKLVNFGFQKSVGRKIDTLIVHSSYDAIGTDPYSVNGVIAEYKSYGVSPHYLIARDGQVYRLVAEQNIAYHAGESKMPDGRTGVNAFSLGAEMLITKTDKPTQQQYDSLNALIVYLKNKYKIINILGHNQIAPGRKNDPWNFEWDKIKK